MNPFDRFTAALISASSFCHSVSCSRVTAIVGCFSSCVDTVAASSGLYVVPSTSSVPLSFINSTSQLLYLTSGLSESR